jgi:hypothetical protein
VFYAAAVARYILSTKESMVESTLTHFLFAPPKLTIGVIFDEKYNKAKQLLSLFNDQSRKKLTMTFIFFFPRLRLFLSTKSFSEKNESGVDLSAFSDDESK